MVRRLEGLSLAIAIATRQPEHSEQRRDADGAADGPRRAGAATRPLRPESVPILAEDVFLAEPDEVFCKACHEATGGQSLDLRSLLITLAVEGLRSDRGVRGERARGRARGDRARRLAPALPAARGRRSARAGDRGAGTVRRARARRRPGRARPRCGARGLTRARSARADPARARARLHPPRRASRRLRRDQALERTEAHRRAAELLAAIGHGSRAGGLSSPSRAARWRPSRRKRMRDAATTRAGARRCQ